MAPTWDVAQQCRNVCMYVLVYVCVCMCLDMHVCLFVGRAYPESRPTMYVFVHSSIHRCIRMNGFMYVCTYLRTHIRTYTYTYTRTYVCTYVSPYVSMYAGTHMYIRTYKSLYPRKISHKYGVPISRICNVPALANAMVRLATNPTLLQRLRCPSPGELAARQHAFVLKSRALLLSEAPPRVLSLAAAAHPHYRRAEYIRCI